MWYMHLHFMLLSCTVIKDEIFQPCYFPYFMVIVNCLSQECPCCFCNPCYHPYRIIAFKSFFFKSYNTKSRILPFTATIWLLSNVQHQFQKQSSICNTFCILTELWHYQITFLKWTGDKWCQILHEGYLLFILRKPRSLLRSKREHGFLRVNRP